LATYDAIGHPLSRTDPLGRSWSSDVRRERQPPLVDDPAGHTVAVTYDAFGSPLAFNDAGGNATQFAYDGAGNLTLAYHALGQTRDTYTYDGHRLPRSHTDALGAQRRSPRRRRQPEHDAAIRRNNVRFAYDGAGRVKSVIGRVRSGHLVHIRRAGNLLSMRDPLGGRRRSTTTP